MSHVTKIRGEKKQGDRFMHMKMHTGRQHSGILKNVSVMEEKCLTTSLFVNMPITESAFICLFIP